VLKETLLGRSKGEMSRQSESNITLTEEKMEEKWEENNSADS